jgi:hypothetical protein
MHMYITFAFDYLRLLICIQRSKGWGPVLLDQVKICQETLTSYSMNLEVIPTHNCCFVSLEYSTASVVI